ISSASSATYDVVVSHDETRAYVSELNGRVWEVNLQSLSVVRSISVSTLAEDLAISLNGRYVFATGTSAANPICVIDTTTNPPAQVSTLNTGSGNNAVVIDPAASGTESVINVVVADSNAGVFRRLSFLPASGTLVNTNQTWSLAGATNVVLAPNG